METKQINKQDKYFKDFFEEKEGIQEFCFCQTFEDGMGLDNVFEVNYTKKDILKIILSFDNETKKKIRDKFVMIDFKNGDINHFLDYLLIGYCKMQIENIKGGNK